MISKELLEAKLLEQQTQELARIYKQNQRFHNFSKIKRGVVCSSYYFRNRCFW